MGLVLVELDALSRGLMAGPRNPLLTATLHASTGGQQCSVYDERCSLAVQQRTIPGETPEPPEAELASIVVRLTAAEPDLHATKRLWASRMLLEHVAAASGSAKQARGFTKIGW